jgi:DNA (cytosine-5)-methyltransferase 1
MLRGISEIKPRVIIGENVSGILNWNGGVVFEEVCTDLESEGYEVQPLVLPAAGVDAPHRRDRVWIIAYANSERERAGHGAVSEKDGEVPEWNENTEPGNSDSAESEDAAYPQQQGLEWTNRQQLDEAKQSAERANTNPCNKGLQGQQLDGAPNSQAEGGRQQPSGSATELRQGDYWQHFPTQPPVCGGDDGLPTRLDGITFPRWRRESLKAYGNAVVPQVAFEIFKAVEETLNH